MKFHRVLFALLLLAVSLILSGAYAQQPAPDVEAAPPAIPQTDALGIELPATDYMTASFNGEQKILTLDTATMTAYDQVMLQYSCFSPLGTEEWTVTFSITLGESTRTVTPATDQTTASPMTAVYYPKAQTFSSASPRSTYQLTVETSQEEWLTYTGAFTARLQAADTAADAVQNTLTITNAYFCFTYDGL